MTFIALCGTALLTAIVHTAVGPDHYLPFIAMGKARGWSMGKTTWVTIIAGFAHVLSSILIGVVGLLLSIQLNILESIEAIRGDFVAWFLIAFGLGYTIWGIVKGSRHEHKKIEPKKPGFVGWSLFLMFAFGPCEPLIPLFMFPAAGYSMVHALVIGLVFLVGTLATMLLIVWSGIYGLKFIPAKLHGHGHTLAGAIVTVSGLLIVLGL